MWVQAIVMSGVWCRVAGRRGRVDGELTQDLSGGGVDDLDVEVVDQILGQPQASTATPWFWSEQYDLKLQMVGLSAGHDRCITRGGPGTTFVCLLPHGRQAPAHAQGEPVADFLVRQTTWPPICRPRPPRNGYVS